MGRQEKRRQAAKNGYFGYKDAVAKQRNIIGFEKRFTSLTEAVGEIPVLLGPNADMMAIMSTPMGKIVFDYAVAGQSDTDLLAQAKLAAHGSDLWAVPGGTEHAAPADLKADRGTVSFTSWQGYGFGWAPHRSGGFTAHVETWPGRIFQKGSPVAMKASDNKWSPVFEFPARGRAFRHMGDVSDLQARIDAVKSEETKKATDTIDSVATKFEPMKVEMPVAKVEVTPRPLGMAMPTPDHSMEILSTVMAGRTRHLIGLPPVDKNEGKVTFVLGYGPEYPSKTGGVLTREVMMEFIQKQAGFKMIGERDSMLLVEADEAVLKMPEYPKIEVSMGATVIVDEADALPAAEKK